MRQRFMVTPAVFVALVDEQNRVLLHRRANTGYMDGFYDFPSGHLEPNETVAEGALRELREEVGVTVDPAHLKLIHINHNDAEKDNPYINFMFRADQWTGAPTICEPEKCDDLDFFAIDNPPKVTPQVRKTLQVLLDEPGLSYSQFDSSNFIENV